MNWDFSGKVIVVTGAARGIGEGIASAFSDAGATVVIVDRDLPAGRQDGATAYRCDITDRAQVDATVADIQARHGHIDVLVNNAGVIVEGRVEELTDEAWARCFDINVAGTFRMCRAVIPFMKAQASGRIVNAASFAAIIPSIDGAAYAASKAAVVQFTRVLAGELGPWNITANAYAPGMVPTGMNGFAELPRAAQDRLLDTLSLRRWETPADVSGAVMFLASDAAAYITGTLLDVSGGKFATQIPSRAHEQFG